MRFSERNALEAGFTRVFEKTVRPALEALEAVRVTKLNAARKWMTICIAGGLALGGLLFFGFGPSGAAFFGGLVFVIIGGIGAFVVRAAQRDGWSESVAGAVMPAICAHIGNLRYDQKPGGGFPVARLQRLGLFGSYSDEHLTDRLQGSYRDTGFDLVEAKLTRKSSGSNGSTNSSTVFKGLLFEIGVPVSVPGRIMIAREHGAFGNALSEVFGGGKGRGMPKLSFDHETFEQVFEVYADDPEAARRFMPTGFLDSLLAIGEAEGGHKGSKAMVAGFEDNSFYMALSRKGDFLAMGSLTTPVADMEEDLHAIFADIEMVHRIIDRLHGIDRA